MAWCARFFRAVDEKETERLVDWFTPDVGLQFANWPRVIGREAALAALDQFFASIAGLEHQLNEAVMDGAKTVVESLVTYKRLDGTSVSIPAATLLDREGDRVRNIRIYVDQAPLWAADAK